VICDPCSGRGWVRAKHVPAVACSLCGGKGELSWGALARKINEYPGTLARVRQGRSRVETYRRVLDKVCKLLWPKGQQGLFS
jgi:hypothetical protein